MNGDTMQNTKSEKLLFRKWIKIAKRFTDHFDFYIDYNE